MTPEELFDNMLTDNVLPICQSCWESHQAVSALSINQDAAHSQMFDFVIE